MDTEIVYLESVNAILAMTVNIAVKVSFKFSPWQTNLNSFGILKY